MISGFIRRDKGRNYLFAAVKYCVCRVYDINWGIISTNHLRDMKNTSQIFLRGVMPGFKSPI